MSGHTPGPWNVETVRTSCGLCHKIGPWPHKWRSGETMHACIYDDYPSPPEGTDTMLANARLIAAAPALLEIVTDLLAVWDPEWEPGKSLHERAVQVIAQAQQEGGQ